MLAGTSTMSTTVASRMTATARRKPIYWNIARGPRAKPPNTETIMRAAPVMMEAVKCSP